MAKVHEYLAQEKSHPVIRELCEMLAMRIAPKQIKIAPVEPTLLQSTEHKAQVIKEIQRASEWLSAELMKLDPNAWMIFDIPNRDVQFTKDHTSVTKEAKESKNMHPLLLRDPVKILTRHGEPKLLVEVSNSVVRILSQYRNFVPRIYVGHKSMELLEKNGVLERMQKMAFKEDIPLKIS